jgi:hypothetical protein
MTIKMKMFALGLRGGKFENEVNEFIRTHKVGQVSMSGGYGTAYVMVLYEED